MRVTTSEYTQPAPIATATSTIMSRVRRRSAATAPSKKIHDDQKITGRLRINPKTSSRSPNGVSTVKFNTSRPSGDHNTIGIANTSATRNRLRMSVTIASIDMAPWLPWPITACGERDSPSSWPGGSV